VINPKYCPIRADASHLTDLSEDRIKTIRRLRRNLKACASCSLNPDDCPIQQNLNATIQSTQHLSLLYYKNKCANII